MKWYLYILECKDSSLYTGITINIEQRIKAHNGKTGSKSLRGKLPVKLVYSEELENRSIASKKESRIKRLSRSEKLELIRSFH